MHFLIYQKMTNNYRDEPDMICHSFPGRLELLKYALDAGIRLYPKEVVLILNGETGEQERGTNDIRSEIARLEAELVEVS